MRKRSALVLSLYFSPFEVREGVAKRRRRQERRRRLGLGVVKKEGVAWREAGAVDEQGEGKRAICEMYAE